MPKNYRVLELNLENCLEYCHVFVYGATWTCEIPYEQEFCGLSEYVQHKKVRSLKKSTGLFQ